MTKPLQSMTIDRQGDDYRLNIQAEGGETLSLLASYDQLDLIADAIDAQLNTDEEDALEVQD